MGAGKISKIIELESAKVEMLRIMRTAVDLDLASRGLTVEEGSIKAVQQYIFVGTQALRDVGLGVLGQYRRRGDIDAWAEYSLWRKSSALTELQQILDPNVVAKSSQRASRDKQDLYVLSTGVKQVSRTNLLTSGGGNAGGVKLAGKFEFKYKLQTSTTFLLQTAGSLVETLDNPDDYCQAVCDYMNGHPETYNKYRLLGMGIVTGRIYAPNKSLCLLSYNDVHACAAELNFEMAEPTGTAAADVSFSFSNEKQLELSSKSIRKELVIGIRVMKLRVKDSAWELALINAARPEGRGTNHELHDVPAFVEANELEHW
jgi:hypothetical protein